MTFEHWITARRIPRDHRGTALLAWDTSRREALEEAAKAAERIAAKVLADSGNAHWPLVDEIKAAILAL
jgi:hypothetical protein